MNKYVLNTARHYRHPGEHSQPCVARSLNGIAQDTEHTQQEEERSVDVQEQSRIVDNLGLIR